MNLHLSFKQTDLVLFMQTGLSIALLLSLSSCSALKSNDYTLKDSLYVWSDAYKEPTETVIEYQSISSLEESILKSDVQLVFESMVSNESVEVELAEQELVEQELVEQEVIEQELDLAEQELVPESQVETPKKNDLMPKQEFVKSEKPAETALNIDTTLVAEHSQNDLDSIDAINRLTKQNPTAAGIPVSKVIPLIKTDVAEIELPKEILQLASPAESSRGVNEFGMWKMVKSDVTAYQEICSLSSSTMQVEVENYSTQVWLKVVGNDLLVNSTTNIDIEKPRVGIKFDNGTLQAFKKSYFETSAVWTGDIETMLKKNKQLSISLGGNELGMRTQEIAIGLTDLKKAYSEYRKCNSGTQISSL